MHIYLRRKRPADLARLISFDELALEHTPIRASIRSSLCSRFTRPVKSESDQSVPRAMRAKMMPQVPATALQRKTR
jgi:hypothetical protein